MVERQRGVSARGRCNVKTAVREIGLYGRGPPTARDDILQHWVLAARDDSGQATHGRPENLREELNDLRGPV